MGRKTFYLVFTENPPAADIVREDYIVELGEDDVCKFRWEVKKDEFSVTTGRVLDKGMKKDMAMKVIDRKGNVLPSSEKVNGIGTRRQEMEKDRLNKKYALEHHVQETAEVLVDEGIDALTSRLHPVMRQKRPSLPKKRNEETKKNIEEALKNMPCFKQTADKVELYLGKGVYLDPAKVNVLRLKFGLEPKKHFQALIRLALPKRIRQMDGVSVSGRRGTVQLNPMLSETISLYVAKVFKEKGKDPKTISYDPDKIIRHLLANSKKGAQTSATMNDQPNPSSRASSATAVSANVLNAQGPSTSQISSPTPSHSQRSTSPVHPFNSPSTSLHSNSYSPAGSPTPAPDFSMHSETLTPNEEDSFISNIINSCTKDNNNNGSTFSEHSYSIEDISFNRVPPEQIVLEYGQF